MTDYVVPDHLVAGSGKTTVFLLHGGYGSKDYWKPEVETLVKAGYRVVAWDRLAPLSQNATLPNAATPLVKTMFAPTSSGPLADLVIDVAASTPTPTFRAAMYAIQAWDGTPVLQKVAVPTLCIAGRHDPVGKPEEMQKLASLIKGADFSVIEDAGHYAWAEQPEAFNRALLGFLKARVAA